MCKTGGAAFDGIAKRSGVRKNPLREGNAGERASGRGFPNAIEPQEFIGFLEDH